MSKICVSCENEEVMAGVKNAQFCGECYASNKADALYYGSEEI